MFVDVQHLDFGALHDDAEEDLVGSDLHQDAITEAHAGIKTYAEEQGLPWYVSKQVMIITTLPGRDEWRPSPDVYVVPGISTGPRSSYDARVEPFPPFIIDVASHSTVGNDLGDKHDAYEYLGTRDYILFDPTGADVGTQVRAWHRGAVSDDASPAWTPWKPDENGVWWSDVLGLGFHPEGVLLRVVRPDGSLVPTRRELLRLPQRIAELEDEVRRLRGE